MKLILCCDYGLDDAAATADVLAHASSDGYREVVLVAVGGNVPRGVSLGNAKKLVAFLGARALIVDTTAEEQPEQFLKTIHGDDGMGDLFPDPEEDVPSVPFAEWLSALSGEYDLLSLGPMTLVPRILGRGSCRRFVFMGGNIAEEPNFRGYEFNHALDRAAFSACVKFPHVAATMDTCRHPLFNVQEREIPKTDVLHRIVARCRERTFLSGEKGCYVWDDIAVKVLRHPEWFSLEEGTDRDGNRLTVAKYRGNRGYLDLLAE